MEGEGCNVRKAPTVIDYGIGAGAGAERKPPVILPKLEEIQHNYQLSSGANYRLHPITCKTKRTQDFIALRY